MEHTPGPWRVDATHSIISADSGISPHICRCGEGEAFFHGTDEGIANARLIAAAPDLLAACEAAVAHRDAIAKQYGYESGDYYEGYGEVMAKIESAITKARGVEV